MEKAAAQQLLTPFQQGAYFWKFSIDALLRGKTIERYQAYQIAIQNGVLSPNEARSLEDWNAYPNGDVYLMPLNMQEMGGNPNAAAKK